MEESGSCKNISRIHENVQLQVSSANLSWRCLEHHQGALVLAAHDRGEETEEDADRGNQGEKKWPSEERQEWLRLALRH